MAATCGHRCGLSRLTALRCPGWASLGLTTPVRVLNGCEPEAALSSRAGPDKPFSWFAPIGGCNVYTRTGGMNGRNDQRTILATRGARAGMKMDNAGARMMALRSSRGRDRAINDLEFGFGQTLRGQPVTNRRV